MHASEDFEAILGLEVHCQLMTASKAFCPCPTDLNAPPNHNTCPICTGHPGVLPSLNKKVVDYAIMLALATNSTLRTRSHFARKHYFYLDLPKGFQITQDNEPIAHTGSITIEVDGKTKNIGIQRIHIEEDAAKNLHFEHQSLVNFNRAGIPLLEIVSLPDLRSPKEASQYLKRLHQIITTLGISHGNLQDGNFRCDINVSVRPKGTEKLGIRTEIKNVNSFKFVEKAAAYEIERHIQCIKTGTPIVRETRAYVADQNKTVHLRFKENINDYRYVIEPDLLSLCISDAWVQEIKNSLPELPEDKKKRYLTTYPLNPYDAQLLAYHHDISALFESTLKLLGDMRYAKNLCNLLIGECLRHTNETQQELSVTTLTLEHLKDLCIALDQQKLSASAAKQVLQKILLAKEAQSVENVIDTLGLAQENDTASLQLIASQIIQEFPQQVEQYRSGKGKLFGFFVGHAMKKTQGKANPTLMHEILKKALQSE